MAIHLVRHANAGGRPAWHQPDDLRPLTNAGVAQAMTIAEVLHGRGVEAILSSRYVRCVQTVQPLADKLGIPLQTTPALAEEASLGDAWALVEDAVSSGRETVLCSHGNIISPLIDRIRRRGIEVIAEELSCHKGSIWSIEVDAGEVTRAVLTLTRA